MTPQEDYHKFLRTIGKTEAEVQGIMASLPEPVFNSALDQWFEINLSEINGLGVFARTPIESGRVFMACGPLGRTILARYVNHSSQPNLVLHPGSDELSKHLFAESSREIREGEEVTFDYLDNMIKQGYSLPEPDGQLEMFSE